MQLVWLVSITQTLTGAVMVSINNPIVTRAVKAASINNPILTGEVSMASINNPVLTCAYQ